MRLPPLSRALVGVAAVLLTALYVVPLWRIDLGAPQYPEGLGLEIRINTVAGQTPYDLDKINGLNHYIGMRAIDPDAIPELRYMPWILGGLIAFAVAAAAVGRRGVLIAWLGTTAIAGVAGLYDFWRWGHDYGHNLDETMAIIKVPGMTYSPPLIGTKQLLNFTATSLPALGGWLAALAFALGVAAMWIAVRRSDQTRPASTIARSRASTPAGGRAIAVAGLASLVSATALAAQVHDTVTVSLAGPVRTIGAALTQVRSGGTIVVSAGTYREPTLVVERPVSIIGRGDAILDGQGVRGLMLVRADDVTIRGLRLRSVGSSEVEDRAAIRVAGGRRCRIEDNRIDDAFFGIALANVVTCRIAGNRLRGAGTSEATSGNGIHLWSSSDITVDSNDVAGHRDGIYLEFVQRSVIRGNHAERNVRYGLHFMFSDDCRYESNIFRGNQAGVAVMYTKRVVMTGNRFEGNWGSAAYGLLLKEITDAEVRGNRFERNTTGLLADGANRLVASDNRFVANGWALRLMASSQDARIERNDFVGNTFDVATNSRSEYSSLAGNYWDAYRGYDVNRDGTGDVPHRPVRLFSQIVERFEPTLVLQRSLLVGLLDVAEMLLPSVTPEGLLDPTPAMRPHR